MKNLSVMATYVMNEKHEQMKAYIQEGKTIWEIKSLLGVSKNTVTNWMKKAGIKTPPGFYNTGKKTGRPAGFKHTEEFKMFMSERFTGSGNPFNGKKHDEETRATMSKNHADFSGSNNPFKRACQDPAFREAHSLRCKNIWNGRGAEYRKIFSEKLSKTAALKPVVSKSKFYKRGFYTTKKNECFHYRSSWEKLVLEDLDNRPDVVHFSLEPFSIEFSDNEIKKHTWIDFLIEFDSKHSAIVEVKPTGLLKKCSLRIETYKDFCFKNNIQFLILDSPYFNGEKDREVVWEEMKNGKHYVTGEVK